MLEIVNYIPDSTFEMSDGTFITIDIYEPYDAFKVKDIWIVYGHEEIQVYDINANLLKTQYTR